MGRDDHETPTCLFIILKRYTLSRRLSVKVGTIICKGPKLCWASPFTREISVMESLPGSESDLLTLGCVTLRDLYNQFSCLGPRSDGSQFRV